MAKRSLSMLVGTVIQLLLPSVKMKSVSERGASFEREFHAYLLKRFGGYTVASGSITGYQKKQARREECNEHREYQVALKQKKDRLDLEKHVANLAGELGEETVFCVLRGKARLIVAKLRT